MARNVALAEVPKPDELEPPDSAEKLCPMTPPPWDEFELPLETGSGSLLAVLRLVLN